MKKLACLMLFVAAVVFVANPVSAGPSSKFAAMVENYELLALDAYDEYCPDGVLSTTIKTSNKADLLIGVSLQTGINTRTKAKGNTKVGPDPYNPVTSSALGGITVEVRIFENIDGSPGTEFPDVKPDVVTYDSRYQELTVLLGDLMDCEDTGNFSMVADECIETCYDETCTGDEISCEESTAVSCPDGKITALCECAFTDIEQWVELLQETVGSHHFNFVARDLEAGEYIVRVDICADTDTVGDANAEVVVGPGSLTVEKVRATNTDDGIVFTP